MPYFDCPLSDCVNHTGQECTRDQVTLIETPYEEPIYQELVCLEYEQREDA